MDSLKFLNEKHEIIIKKFDIEIERFLYEYTESDRFDDGWGLFREMQQEIIDYHNKFFDKIGDISTLNEWIYTYPNFMYFGLKGFLIGKHTVEDIEDLQDSMDRFHDVTIRTVEKLSVMLEKEIIKAEAKTNKEEEENV